MVVHGDSLMALRVESPCLDWKSRWARAGEDGKRVMTERQLELVSDGTWEPIRVLFVCLGNICRSPLAEAVFRHQVEERGWADRFEIDSAGTSGWHRGAPPDARSAEVARRR